jgi:hypothetical protein
MRRIVPLVLVALALLPGRLGAQEGSIFSLERHLGRHPCDYAAREDLVAAYRQSGDHAAAYYHAAWLAWLATRQW